MVKNKAKWKIRKTIVCYWKTFFYNVGFFFLFFFIFRFSCLNRLPICMLCALCIALTFNQGKRWRNERTKRATWRKYIGFLNWMEFQNSCAAHENETLEYSVVCIAFFPLFSIPMRDKWQSFHRISKAIRTENKVKIKRKKKEKRRKRAEEKME